MAQVWRSMHEKGESALIDNDIAYIRQHLADCWQAAIPIGIDGTMPYIFCADNLEMVKLLLKQGFPIDYQNNEYALQIFHI